jgi:hypothetical protein
MQDFLPSGCAVSGERNPDARNSTNGIRRPPACGGGQLDITMA